MKKAIMAIMAIMAMSCAGPLWDGESRHAGGETGAVTIRLFEGDPLAEFLIERYSRHIDGDHALCGDHEWLEGDK